MELVENGVNSADGVGSVVNANDSLMNDNPRSIQQLGSGSNNNNNGLFEIQIGESSQIIDYDSGEFLGHVYNALDLGLEDEQHIEDFYDQYDKFVKNANHSSSHHQSLGSGVWLIAPLIKRLPSACQIKVLDHACNN